MYKRLLHIACMLSLSGCVYYGDLHGNAKPLSVAQLNTHHVYAAKTIKPSANWWNRFHDPLLNQLIDTALADDPNMQMAEARLRRAQAIVKGAVAPLWPSIDFSGYAQRQRFSEFGLAPPPFNGQIFNIGELGFNLNYEFDLWGKNREMLAARVNEQCAAQADIAEARLVISAAVANVYFQLLGDQALLKLAKENANISQKLSDIVVARSSHGIASDIPVKNALASAQSTRLAIQQYQQAVKLAKHQLAILSGKNPFTTEIQTSRFAYHKQHVKLPDNLTINVLAQRPDIYASKLRAEAAAHEINVAKARFYPDITLNALFSYQSIEFSQLFAPGSQNNAITGAIDLPIFDAGLRRANLGIKYAEYDLAVDNYNQTVLTALRETADQQAIIQSVISQLQSQDSALRATENIHKLFRLRYNHGIIDYVQVLEIKQVLLQYQQTQLDLQTRHLQAIVGLLKALGGNETSMRG